MVVGKAYLHERVLYEYMYYRAQNNMLMLKLVVAKGKPQYKPKTLRVDKIDIINGNFPDVERIKFNKQSIFDYGQPAEVKFLTSEFNYHKEEQYIKAFKDFFNNNGFIIVLRHDNPPTGLLENYPIDIYELDYDDFNLYVKENHDRLLHKQILGRSGYSHKNLMFSATRKNFYGRNVKYNDQIVFSALNSGIWCPSKLTDPYEVALNDKVLFIRFSGPQSTQVAVRKYYAENKAIHPEWIIKSIWIGEVTIPLMSREQYCEKVGIDTNDPLWPSEVDALVNNNQKYWPQVFGFKITKTIEKCINLADAYEELNELVYPKLFNLFIQQNAIEITDLQYINFLEWLTTYNQTVINSNQIFENVNDTPQIEN